VVGDAAVPVEAWVQGAVAMSYQAVKAIEKELNGQKVYAGYMACLIMPSEAPSMRKEES